MNEWFVEVLDRNDNWVRWDRKPYESYGAADKALCLEGLTDENCWYRIIPEWNDRYSYYGPCH